MAQFNYDPTQHRVQANLERLPKGWYPMIVFDSGIEPTAKKDGFKLIVHLQVIDGPAKGRKLQKSFNIDNPNPKAVEIAMSEIKALCVCCGIHTRIDDTQALHNRPFQALLTEPKDSDYNDVKGFKTIEGIDPDKVGAGAPVGHVQQPPQGYAQPAYGTSQVPPQYAQPAAPQQPYGAPPAYAAPAAPAAPAWAPQAPPPAAPAYAQPPQPAAPPAYAQPQQQAAAPAYAAPAAPAAPAWAPQAGAAPAAPAWAPPQQ